MLVLTWWEIWCQSHCACYSCTDVSQWFLSPCWLGRLCQLKMLERNCTWHTRYLLSGEHSHFFLPLPEPGVPENHGSHWTGPSSSFQDSAVCLARSIGFNFPISFILLWSFMIHVFRYGSSASSLSCISSGAPCQTFLYLPYQYFLFEWYHCFRLSPLLLFISEYLITSIASQYFVELNSLSIFSPSCEAQGLPKHCSGILGLYLVILGLTVCGQEGSVDRAGEVTGYWGSNLVPLHATGYVLVFFSANSWSLLFYGTPFLSAN